MKSAMKIQAIKPLCETYEDFCRAHPFRAAYFDAALDDYPSKMNHQLEKRPEVWNVGLWPDAASEQIAKRIAKICEETGLVPCAAFVPDDSLEVINDIGVEIGLMPVIRSTIEHEFSCRLGREEISRNSKLRFGEFVRRIKDRVGTVRESSETEPLRSWYFDQALLNKARSETFARIRNEDAIFKSISNQLMVRSEVWGVGLWLDAETERIAKVCANSLSFMYGLKSSAFIPDDSIAMLFKSDADSISYAIESIESEFHYRLDVSEFDGLMDISFRDFVEVVKKCVGKKLPKDKKGLFHDWQKSKFGILPNLAIYIVWPLVSLIAIYEFHAFARQNFRGSFLASRLLIWIVWLSIAVLTMWYNGRKYSRDYVYGNVLRFLLSFLAGSAIYGMFFA